MTRDLSFAIRSLTRSPGPTLVALAAIALGIGANTAIFSVVDGVLLKPFPYADADRLVTLSQLVVETGRRDGVSAANAMDLGERATTLSGTATMAPYGVDFIGPDGPMAIDTWLVTEQFFSLLGVPAALGRTLQSDDYAAGRNVAVIAHQLWQEQFGGDPDIVGRILPAGESSLEIVGVMPPDFQYPAGRQLWTTVRYDRDRAAANRGAAYLDMVARLAPGATVEQAGQELRAIMAALGREHPEANRGYSVAITPLPTHLLGATRPALVVLLGAVWLLLLLAAANVANLMLIRAADRARDAAVLAALGASRWRLLRQGLTEHLVLGLAGGAAGVLLAHWALDLIVRFAPADLPRIDQVAVDGRVLLAATGACLLMVLMFGWLPSTRLARGDLRGALTAGGGRGTGGGVGREGRRLREGLVVVQIALAVILLTGAGLLVRSFITLAAVDRGYRTEGVVASTVQSWGYFGGEEERVVFAREVVQRMRALPGVRSAGVTSALPLSDPIGNEHADVEVPGEPPTSGSDGSVHAAAVDGGYFRTLGIQLHAGRLFDSRDGAGGAPVVLINQTLRRRLFPDSDPVGRELQVRFWGAPQRMEVVGVVGDVRTGSLEQPAPPTLYVPHAQAPTGALTFVARAEGEPAATLERIREILGQFNPLMPVENPTTLQLLMGDALRERRFHLFLLGSFALVALALAAIGTYGVISYTMRRRTREIGIRIALGATARGILAWTLGRGFALVLAGLLVGLLASIPLTRTLESLLYGVSPLDPLTLAAACLLLALIATAAMALPARAAAGVDPTESMRGQ